MFSKVVAAIVVSFGVCTGAFAAEGMWTPDNLPHAALEREYGFSPDPGWVARARRAAVHVSGGCSGAFVSPDGLVLTSRQCVSACVKQLSTADKDFARTGFLASAGKDEAKCAGLELDRLDAIVDVTARVKAALAGKTDAARRDAEAAMKAQIEQECVGKDAAGTRCEVVDLYQGGVYSLYQYHRFSDVRLVFAPEQAMAFFGGEPNHFDFPRYGFDAAVLRAYENDRPATVADFFPFSKSGAKEGEMTVVVGDPGASARQMTITQLDTLHNRDIAHALLRFSELRGVLTRYSAESAEHQRIAQNDLANVEALLTTLKGRFEALQDPALLDLKRAQERDLRDFVAADPVRSKKYAAAWDEIAAAERVYSELELPFQYMEGRGGFFSKYLGFARALVRGAAARAPGAERGKPATERLSETQQLFSTAPIYPEYEKVKLGFTLTQVRDGLGIDHPFVRKVLGKESPQALAGRLVDGTRLGDIAVRRALWDGGAAAIGKSADSFIAIARSIEPDAAAIRREMEERVESVIGRNTRLIAQARFEKYGSSVYPEASSTQRFSFGEVKGWEKRGTWLAPFTDIGGAFAQAASEGPFALPPSWREAKAALDPAQPLNFITSNDVVGGNSGSPVINRGGELVGLVYGGNFASLGGDYGFDERANRAVSVHSGALLEVLRKVYKAERIVAEIEAASRH